MTAIFNLAAIGTMLLSVTAVLARTVSPPSSQSLTALVATAAPGSTVLVRPGVYRGPLVIDKPLSMVGQAGAIIDGGGKGTVVLIQADHVHFSGFTVRASGTSLDREDTGIKVLGNDEEIRNNVLEDVLFGIYLKNSSNSVVAGNFITGKPLPLPIRGDAIRLWYCMNGTIENNHITEARDVILWFSKHGTIQGNVVQNSRYGLHLMYDDGIEITDNTLTRNFVGAFLMYSEHIAFERNVLLENRGVSGYGIGVKNINNLLAVDNRFLGNQAGIFMNSSPSSLNAVNVFRRNIVAFNDVGLSLDPSNEGKNIFTLNAFIENVQQVANTGGGTLQGDMFSHDGRGNFWSDYTGYPAQDRETGAIPYQVHSLFDNLTDQYERLKLFRFSPVEQAVNLAATAFPLVQPHEVLTDPAPLLSPVPVHAAALPKGSIKGITTAATSLFGFVVVFATILGIVPRHRKRGRTSPAMNNTAFHPIEIHALRKLFGSVEVLRGVSLTVEQGMAVALWGDNGAGKSTMIKCVMGLLDYDGLIDVAGLDAKENGKAVRQLIGYVPQELHFYNDWSVDRTMAFYADLKRASRGEIADLLRDVGIERQAHKSVGALSGGLKQRMALAIALLGQPRILLLDEFTASLDTETRTYLLDFLRRLRADGSTILFTAHRPEEVEMLADRVVMMEGGRVTATLLVEEFLFRLSTTSHAGELLHHADKGEPALLGKYVHRIRASVDYRKESWGDHS